MGFPLNIVQTLHFPASIVALHWQDHKILGQFQPQDGHALAMSAAQIPLIVHE